MNLLTFYVSEKQHHGSVPTFDWLLAEAKAMGMQGSSVPAGDIQEKITANYGR